jgi:hypothetical protein
VNHREPEAAKPQPQTSSSSLLVLVLGECGLLFFSTVRFFLGSRRAGKIEATPTPTFEYKDEYEPEDEDENEYEQASRIWKNYLR